MYNHLRTDFQSLLLLLTLEVPNILAFPGILAASTERQFTQEAITSTGGLMTDVNLSDGKHTNGKTKSFLVASQESFKTGNTCAEMDGSVKLVYLCSNI